MAGDIKLTGTACRPRAFVKSNAVQHAGWIRMAGIFPIQVVILTAILMSNGCDGKSNDTPVSSDARVLSIGTSGLPTIEMSESEFSNWLLKRSRFEEHL